MGKKYIIELEEPEIFDEQKFYQCTQMPWLAVSENVVENLTPYIEPDLEQIKKEAYAKAYADAVCNCSEGCSHVEQVMKEAYEQGMIDERERIINIILDGGTI